jgi:hypothetical protein
MNKRILTLDIANSDGEESDNYTQGKISVSKKPASGKTKGKRLTNTIGVSNLALEVDVSIQNSEDYESQNDDYNLL